MSCHYQYLDSGIIAYGQRCSGYLQHCYYNWYNTNSVFYEVGIVNLSLYSIKHIYLIILGQWVKLKLLFRLARTFYQQDAQINLIKYLNNIQSVTSSNTLIIIPTIFAWKIMPQLTLRSVTSPWTGCRGRLTTQTLMTVRTPNGRPYRLPYGGQMWDPAGESHVGPDMA